MNCEILIRATDNGFAATILGLPDCTTEAATRDEAIEKVKAEAEDLLAKSEIVQAEIEGRPKRKSFAGMWANDKTFDKFLAAMKAYREELNAETQPARVGPGMWKDNELYDEFVAALKEARAEIDANPDRL